MAYPYSTERSGFTGPRDEYHIDLKLSQSLPILERVKKFDALAKQYQAIGRDIEFSNTAVSGRRYNPSAEISEKIDLLNAASAAHSHSKHPGWDSFDYYVPFKGKSRFDKGVVEGASIYLPTVAGGKVRRGSGGGYGYYSESLDPSGRVIARVGHGDIDRPEAGDVNVLGQAPPALNLPPASEEPAQTPTQQLPQVTIVDLRKKDQPSKTFAESYRDQLLAGILNPSNNTGASPVMFNPMAMAQQTMAQLSKPVNYFG